MDVSLVIMIRNSKQIYKFITITLGLLCFLSASLKADLTAAAVKADLDRYLGKKVTFKIPFVRAIQAGAEEEEGLRFLTAMTVDEDNKSRGGTILIVTTTEKFNSMVKKYGTTAERGGRKLDLNTIRGTISSIDDKKRSKIFLDTAGGIELNKTLKKRLMKHADDTISGKHLSKKKNKPGKY